MEGKMVSLRKRNVLSTIILIALLALLSEAGLNPDGVKCGQKRCAPAEYCSPFDSQCKPCSIVCDPDNHDRQPEICVADCQEYLHDQRYVLRTDLRKEIGKLKITICALLSLVCLLVVGLVLFACSTFMKWRNMKSIVQKTWNKRKWLRRSPCNKIKVDVETAAPKLENSLQVTVPTISGVVASQNSTNSCQNNNSNDNNDSNAMSNMSIARKVPSENSTVK